jgi:hypothetical protein
MQGTVKRNKANKLASFQENAVAALVALTTFLGLTEPDHQGIPKQWVSAWVATLIPFGFVSYAFPERLHLWSFRASLAISLIARALVIGAFFPYVLINFQRSSILFWLP